MIDIDQPGPSCRQFLSTETSAIGADVATPSGTITSANMKVTNQLCLLKLLLVMRDDAKF
ncbi:unnamed protein product [Ceutorhynchus assimilis]|uniref:Uncharacterized protein n=1 Tax=Ceutorhynchus assimilis TaxID=467358 RepID=A0A9N9MR14_9CUCU|nr:unnamed protein product [Ceutorhynchus assimilis]